MNCRAVAGAAVRGQYRRIQLRMRSSLPAGCGAVSRMSTARIALAGCNSRRADGGETNARMPRVAVASGPGFVLCRFFVWLLQGGATLSGIIRQPTAKQLECHDLRELVALQ